MTKSEWLEAAETAVREEEIAGFLPDIAAAAALRELLASWRQSLDDGISPRVLIHDLKEVARVIVLIHNELIEKLPNVLEEMADL